MFHIVTFYFKFVDYHSINEAPELRVVLNFSGRCQHFLTFIAVVRQDVYHKQFSGINKLRDCSY